MVSRVAARLLATEATETEQTFRGVTRAARRPQPEQSSTLEAPRRCQYGFRVRGANRWLGRDRRCGNDQRRRAAA
jgi:hypothetical protein